MESVGQFLKRARVERGMSVDEIARITRIPARSIVSLENDRFEDLPGEVFVRGFLKAYARALPVSVDELLARYTSSRRVTYVAPLPTLSRETKTSTRFGLAIGLTVLLILLTVALSIVLVRRGRGRSSELSANHPQNPIGLSS